MAAKIRIHDTKQKAAGNKAGGVFICNYPFNKSD